MVKIFERLDLTFAKRNHQGNGNACGDIATTITKITLENDNIRLSHELSKEYIYGIIDLKVKQIKNESVEYNMVNLPCTPGLRSRWEKSLSPCVNPTTI